MLHEVFEKLKGALVDFRIDGSGYVARKAPEQSFSFTSLEDLLVQLKLKEVEGTLEVGQRWGREYTDEVVQIFTLNEADSSIGYQCAYPFGFCGEMHYAPAERFRKIYSPPDDQITDADLSEAYQPSAHGNQKAKSK